MGRKQKQKKSQKYSAPKQQTKYEQGGAFANESEEYAESILLELRDKEGVLDFVTHHRVLDDAGIDWVVGRYLTSFKHRRILRIHIQQKSSEGAVAEFMRFNPCIPVWVVRVETDPLQAKIALVRIIIDALNHRGSPEADFFIQKLKYFADLQGSA